MYVCVFCPSRHIYTAPPSRGQSPIQCGKSVLYIYLLNIATSVWSVSDVLLKVERTMVIAFLCVFFSRFVCGIAQRMILYGRMTDQILHNNLSIASRKVMCVCRASTYANYRARCLFANYLAQPFWCDEDGDLEICYLGRDANWRRYI